MAYRILKIDHLRIAVPGAEAAASAFEALGFSVEATQIVPTEKGQDGAPPRGRIAPRAARADRSFIGDREVPESRKWLHHVCVLVDDIEAAITELKARVSSSSTTSH